MVFSNFLEEKTLSKACNMKPYQAYELTVWINMGEQHLEWSECDTSEDGKEMTELVQGIQEVLEGNPTYQTLPAVKGSYE